MVVTLDSIKAPVKSELKKFESFFKQSMRSQVPLLDRITYYIVKSKGKQLRPVFVFLSSKMIGEINKSSFNAASFIEIIHTASLVHDDVVDDSNIRRGFFSINAIWKNKIAVLVGDYLFSKGMLLAVDNEEYALLRIMSTTLKKLSEGELLQVEKARKLDIDEEVYFSIIEQKTAALISAACASGAAAVSEDKALIQKMADFGTKIGIAFQIKDDLLDYGDADIGKPRAIDIKEKKMTLPIIYTLANTNRSEKRWIINTIKNHNTDKKRVRELITRVHASGGIEYTKQKMNLYRDEALLMLDSIQDSEAKTSMKDLVHFVIDRKK
ncbi:MAG: polyprenyl synthetase family protein [Flavobacteriales bacterium]|nr:polyprenyl synthetase family protein [Flavobacteriales bacterium]